MNNRVLLKVESNSEVLNKGELQRCIDPEIFSGVGGSKLTSFTFRNLFDIACGHSVTPI